MPTPYTKTISGVAQSKRRSHGGLELRDGTCRHQIPLQELLQHGSKPSVHHELGRNQQGNRHQIANVHFHVEQEGNRHAAGQQPSFPGREEQKRKPSCERDGDDPLSKHR
jgi:hypothetical protein